MIFSSRKSAKIVKFSTDKHAQPNFVRDSCVYATFGLCDHNLRFAALVASRLGGLVVKWSASRAEGTGIDSLYPLSSHTSDLNIGALVDTLV